MYEIEDKMPRGWDGTTYIGNIQIVCGSGAAGTFQNYTKVFKASTVPKVVCTALISGSFGVWYMGVCIPSGHQLIATGAIPYQYVAIGIRA